jgi:hypothetical protein
MSLFSDVFATQIIFYSQFALIAIVVFFFAQEWVLSTRRKPSFVSYANNVSAFDVPEWGTTQLLLTLLIVAQFILLGLAVLSGAFIYAIVYLANLSVLSIVWMFSLVGFATNRNLTVFKKDFQRIHNLLEMLPKQEERLASYNQQYDYFKVRVDQRHSEFASFVSGNTFTISYGKLVELRELIKEIKQFNLVKQIDSLKNEFETALIAYIATNHKKTLTTVSDSIPNESALDDILTGVDKYLADDTKQVSKELFKDFSNHDEATIIRIIDLATKYRFSVTSKEIDMILERVKVLPSKSELLNRLYSSNAITAPVIIGYLEQNQDWIITPQMYDILKSGELSNVLSLLVEKDLFQSAKKFLQQLPVLKLQILYRVTGEANNPTSDLILEFRSFLPLRFMFSDPSTMYFNMYNALVETNAMKEFFDESFPLSEEIIKNKTSIMEQYQEEYERTSALRQRFESVKLNLLSSNLRQSSLIKLETAMELFYQYVVNLRQAEATLLFDFLEAVFFVEETDPIKIEEYLTNKGTPVGASVSMIKHHESGKSKLKQLLNKERVLIKQLMSRVEQTRQAYDRLLEMVK